MNILKRIQKRFDDLGFLGDSIDRCRQNFENEIKAGTREAQTFWARMHDSYVREYNARKFWFMGLEGELGYNEPAAFPVM